MLTDSIYSYDNLIAEEVQPTQDTNDINQAASRMQGDVINTGVKHGVVPVTQQKHANIK